MNTFSVVPPMIVDVVLKRAGADDEAVPGTQAWALAQIGLMYSALVNALLDCVDAEQPMAQMRATERAREVLGVAKKNSARCAIRSAGLATGLRTDLDVTLSVIAELRARNALRSLDSALRESSSEGVTVYIGPNKTEQRLRAQLDELISCRQRRTADPSGDASAG